MKDPIISKEQIKRNPDRFPESFRFQLNTEERNELVANCDRFELLKSITLVPHSRISDEEGIADKRKSWILFLFFIRAAEVGNPGHQGAGIPRQ